ncbi:MAG: mechanosensitive ion channel family protein [Bacteroidales bacterium]|jgi:small-conductance mechanosensitive channel|nr:mechanosensitive ion channel family protein [Bacteroidales bacterium]
MKNICLLFILFCFFVPYPIDAQISKITGNIFGTDKKIENKDRSLKDSLRIAELTGQLELMKMNESVYLDQLSRSKFTHASDSMKQARQRIRIDSLRQISNGVPLVIEGDTLFSLYAARGGVTVHDRVENAENRIIELGKDRGVIPDSIYLLLLEDGMQTEIMYGHKVIMSVTQIDALWMNMDMESLAKIEKEAVISAVKTLQHKNSLLQVFKRIGLFLLILVIQVLFLFLTNWLYRRLKALINKNTNKWFKPLVIRNYQLLSPKNLAKICIAGGNIMRYVVIFLQLLISIPLIFSVFPQTKKLASVLFGYIINPIKSIVISIVNYIPNLFTIAIIWLCIRYLVKGVAYVSREVQNEKLKIPGFYTDWAMPTYHIIKFLLYAFMIAMIYPHLPGASSGGFQGISIFVGLIVSLGSTTAISNIIAGMVITYMRPFKIGDRIKLNDTEGNVIEKTSFVTRIKTSKNEVITIPNSFVMSSHTTNYSASARDYGLIIHTNISVGYDIPWQKVHECLVKAAKMTKNIIREKEPFVLDLGLEDYYNVYQVNVYISNADAIPQIMTELHTNIQDVFKQEGLNMESPFLVSERNH